MAVLKFLYAKKSCRRYAFTLIELLVVVSIIALLVSILLPALGKARDNARSLVCKTNLKSIATGIFVYSYDNEGVTPVTTEAPWINAIVGKRTTPLILRDGRYVDITGKDGGVWRCPLDKRNYTPHFLAYYYYYEGGPGLKGECPKEGLMMSYSANALFRLGSEKCPWSFYDGSKNFVRRKVDKAKHPSSTVMAFDSAHSWDVSSPDPYTLFYTWVTTEYKAGTSVYDMSGYWRHKRSNYGPYGNFAFMDGHADGGFDYLKTCSQGLVYDAGIADLWWSY